MSDHSTADERERVRTRAVVPDDGSGGPDNDLTDRNTTFMTWNLMHLGWMIKQAGGIPAHGNRRSEWDAGCCVDSDNPEHRSLVLEDRC